ncbi:MAG: RagB/SusD family nutrient uptake outer membrane protein [Bacteroidota bacterium]
MKINKYIILIIIGLFATTSCKKMLMTEPKQSISPEIALTSTTGVNALLNNVYTSFGGSGNYGLARILSPEVQTDHVINTSTNNNSYRTQEANQVGVTQGSWTDNYGQIYRANLVIDAIDNGILLNASDANKNMFKGEALFFRALAYFQLAMSYSYIPGNEVNEWNKGVPIILKPTKTLDEVEFAERATNVQVYQLIKKDLASSIELLNNTGRASKAYVSKAAAQALLSRVSLYTLDLDATISNSTAVLTTSSINGKATSLAQTGTDLITMWRTYKDKSESIWQISKNSQDNLGGGSIQAWFSIYPKPVNAGCVVGGPNGNPARVSLSDLRVAPAFYALFDAADIRKTQLIDGPYCKSGQTGLFYSNKYSGTGGENGLDDIVVFRTSEMLLNRAEAYARKGDVANAINDVNIIRTRAGLTALPLSTTADAALSNILLQRRFELAFEGHRWNDLIRTKSDIIKDPSALYATSPVDYTDRRILAQIPTAQIDVNPKLVQNPGY